MHVGSGFRSPPPAISLTGDGKPVLTMAAQRPLSPLDVLVLFSAWCGLAGGLLEAGTRVVCKSTSQSTGCT